MLTEDEVKYFEGQSGKYLNNVSYYDKIIQKVLALSLKIDSCRTPLKHVMEAISRSGINEDDFLMCLRFCHYLYLPFQDEYTSNYMLNVIIYDNCMSYSRREEIKSNIEKNYPSLHQKMNKMKLLGYI